jgi:hypothetical protein
MRDNVPQEGMFLGGRSIRLATQAMAERGRNRDKRTRPALGIAGDLVSLPAAEA